jgi:hypothetical protein
MLSTQEKLQRIQREIGLPELCRELGITIKLRSGSATNSPFRRDSNASFAVWFKNGTWAWKDYGTGRGGGVVQFYREATGSTHPMSDLYNLWFENGKKPTMHAPKESKPSPPVPLDWSERVSKLTDDMVKRLAEWRGYSEEFCFWMREIKTIGSYGSTYCFPIYNAGHVVRFHVRWPSGMWQYQPFNICNRLTPLILGNGRCVHAFESQWDMFAVMSLMPMEYVLDCRWIATRGSGNSSGRVDYIWRQNDDTADKQASELRWARRFDCGEYVFVPPHIKDANDWLRQERDAMAGKLEEWFL